MNVRITQVQSMDDCQRCRDLAAAVWGTDAACSTAQMMVHVSYGGVALLAWHDQQPVGFLFSFPAMYRGETVLWSHETAVLADYLHHGIGRQLKETQRRIARDLGYRHIAWTFDPLVARNAYFNVRKLGAQIEEYKRNAYGVDPGDLVNQGMETDRFIALWSTEATTHADTNREDRSGIARSVLRLSADGRPEPLVDSADSSDLIATEIPRDFTGLIEQDSACAVAWRIAFRAVAEERMAHGWRPTQVVRQSDRAIYIWERVEA